MKRLLYLLLTAAVSGISPTSIDASDMEDDPAGAVDDSSSGRRASGMGTHAPVIVLPLEPDQTVECDCLGKSLVVESTTEQMVAISGNDVGDANVPSEAHSVQLLDKVLRDAWEHDVLKVAIDLPLSLEEVTRICGNNRFTYSRTVMQDGHLVHEFLADLYTAARTQS